MFIAAVLALSTLVVWLSSRLYGWQFSPAEMFAVFFIIMVLGRILIALLNRAKPCN
jgi:hypothetical protein